MNKCRFPISFQDLSSNEIALFLYPALALLTRLLM